MPSQKPVEAPQEGPTHSLTDNTIPDNEHARKDASKQLERARVEVAAEQAEAKLVAEEARKKEVAEAKAKEKASVRAKESVVTKSKQVSSKKATVKAKEKKKKVVVSRGNKSEATSKVFEATFYTAYCNTGCTGVTATGFDVRETIYVDGLRVIAVDKSVIPLYSLVRVTLADGTSFNAIAGDTGGAIKGYKIDVLVSSKDEARKLGRQKVAVKVLRSGK